MSVGENVGGNVGEGAPHIGVLTSGPLGTMQSKCANAPTTCGFLYCM